MPSASPASPTLPGALAAWIERHARRLALALCALLFCEVAALTVLTGDRLRFPDEHEYHALALHLARGEGFVNEQGLPTAYRPPGYPLLLSALYRLAPSAAAAKLLNGALLALAAFWLSQVAARRSELARALTPACFLAYPLLAFTASTLYAQTLALFLLAGALRLLLAPAPPSPGRGLVLGLTWGALILTVPSFLMLLPLLLAGIAWRGRHRPAGAAGAVLLCLLATLLTAGAWTARNRRALDAFVLVSTNSGISLITGNSPHAGADTGVHVNLDAYREKARTMSEVEQDRYYKAEAIAWMRQNPADALRLYAAKLANFFNFRSNLHVKAESSPARDALMFATYYALLGVVAARALRFRRRPPDEAEFFLFALYLGGAVVSALFFTRIRLRVPFDAALALLAARALAGWLEARRAPTPPA